MEELGKSAEKALGASFADLIGKLYDVTLLKAGIVRDKARLKFFLGFEEYLNSTMARCAFTKTLIDRHDPVRIDDLYIGLTYKIGTTSYENSGIIGRVRLGKQVIVTGIAGSGKSITLKKLYMTLVQERETIPVFLELRNLSEGGIIDSVQKDISVYCGDISDKALIYGLRRGILCLILDGFDEIPSKQKIRVEREIHSIIASAPNCQMLISGRPSQRYQSWHSVSEAQIQDLEKPRVVELIANYRFDEDAKASLIQDIEKKLYNSHRKLLSNPLLATLMLLTYHEFSQIPDSLHVYYRKAFEVLVRKHDALKPMYVREFNTDISEETFRGIFETFCYLSFVEGRFSFSKLDAFRYIESSINYENIDCEIQDYLNDLIDNVCILASEGEEVTFIHRSFQEYFAANFIIARNHENAKEIIDGISDTFLSAGVLNFMIDMNSEALERRYLLPAVEEIINYLQRLTDEEMVFGSIVSGILVKQDGNVVPIIDTNTDRWIRPAFIAIQNIFGERLALPRIEDKLLSRIKDQKLPSVVAGGTGIKILGSDSLFREIAMTMKYGGKLQDYFLRVQSEVREKENRRDKIIKKYNAVRGR